MATVPKEMIKTDEAIDLVFDAFTGACQLVGISTEIAQEYITAMFKNRKAKNLMLLLLQISMKSDMNELKRLPIEEVQKITKTAITVTVADCNICGTAEGSICCKHAINIIKEKMLDLFPYDQKLVDFIETILENANLKVLLKTIIDLMVAKDIEIPFSRIEPLIPNILLKRRMPNQKIKKEPHELPDPIEISGSSEEAPIEFDSFIKDEVSKDFDNEQGPKIKIENMEASEDSTQSTPH